MATRPERVRACFVKGRKENAVNFFHSTARSTTQCPDYLQFNISGMGNVFVPDHFSDLLVR